MTRFVYAILTFLLLAVSLPTVILPPKDRVRRPARFRQVPLVAKHPTCPVEILAVRNLNPRREFFWHEVEVVVRNRTPEPISDLVVSLFIRSAGIDSAVPFRLNGRRSPVIPPGVVCLAPVPAEERRSLAPQETVTLYCCEPRNHNQKTQALFDNSTKTFFEVHRVDFKNIQWDFAGRFQVFDLKNEQITVDEAFTNRMHAALQVPANWEKSRQYREEYLSVIQ